MPSMPPEWEEYALLLRARRRDQFGPRSKIVRLRRLLEHWPPSTASGEIPPTTMAQTLRQHAEQK